MSIVKQKEYSKEEKQAFFRLEVEVPAELMTFLIQSFPGKSRSAIKSFLVHKQVQVNNLIVTHHNYLLKSGDIVSVNKGKGPSDLSSNEIKILFEDAFLVVVEKESGLLSIATAGEKERTAYSLLSQHVKQADAHNRIFVVHRLDRETSGVMMFAKSQRIQEELQKNWQSTVLERSYIALVEGVVEKTEGTIQSWLKESSVYKIHSSQSANNGQLAITHYKLLKQNKQYSLLKVDLETGRKNQIRVHMQEIGHPVAGDKKYGASTNPLQRLGLHASILAFQHPVSREVLKFESAVPRKFSRVIA